VNGGAGLDRAGQTQFEQEAGGSGTELGPDSELDTIMWK